MVDMSFCVAMNGNIVDSDTKCENRGSGCKNFGMAFQGLGMALAESKQASLLYSFKKLFRLIYFFLCCYIFLNSCT